MLGRVSLFVAEIQLAEDLKLLKSKKISKALLDVGPSTIVSGVEDEFSSVTK